MKLVLTCWVLLVASVFAAPNSLKADTCDKENCKLPSCSCFSTDIPNGLKLEETPQFVFLTFDDAVTELNYDYYSQVLYNKTNPDKCEVAATYFVSHEYTDYSKVNDLWAHGHEIALHSITHSASTDYWRNIDKKNLTDEFGGEKQLMARFANISEDAIKGLRLPFLQLSGDNSFEVAKEVGLQYDCSWPTQSFDDPPAWPYTLDFESPQDCPIGPCPTKSIPGMWVVPMVNWRDLDDVICSMVDACLNIPSDEDGILEWYKTNFDRHYKTNKAPFGFYVHAAWFSLDESHIKAYIKFVDYLQSLNDVFIVGIERAVEWMQNPVPIGSADWPICPKRETSCKAKTCKLMKGVEERYMTLCGDCPPNYPWIGNPLGE